MGPRQSSACRPGSIRRPAFFLYLRSPSRTPIPGADLGPYADEKWTPDTKAIRAMITRMDSGNRPAD